MFDRQEHPCYIDAMPIPDSIPPPVYVLAFIATVVVLWLLYRAWQSRTARASKVFHLNGALSVRVVPGRKWTLDRGDDRDEDKSPREWVELEGEELSPREKEVARLARAGLSNKEIAEQLCISVRTVDHHMEAVHLKLHITSRAELRYVSPDLLQ